MDICLNSKLYEAVKYIEIRPMANQGINRKYYHGFYNEQYTITTTITSSSSTQIPLY